ncbi:hypothetical protein CHARACLAT_007034 [Characodon lateralis]|uniref:Uncharacterized protein n=1 Tax=Characodon lateralis TaxID=208331 RepID=A0ABU7E7Z6_9TELE|nr:hypothetical protein [Characodon lateralis]
MTTQVPQSKHNIKMKRKPGPELPVCPRSCCCLPLDINLAEISSARQEEEEVRTRRLRVFSSGRLRPPLSPCLPPRSCSERGSALKMRSRRLEALPQALVGRFRTRWSPEISKNQHHVMSPPLEAADS